MKHRVKAAAFSQALAGEVWVCLLMCVNLISDSELHPLPGAITVVQL